jgi:uncharacterized membrane protein YphA (DoxX/SURF4 family)
MPIHNAIAIACRLLLASVFLFAGIPKLLDLGTFAGIIEAYGLVPEPLLLPVAVIVAAGEVVGAIGLLLGRRYAPYLLAVLLLLFILVLAYGIRLGLDIDCGCFSADDPEHQAFSGLRTALIRDIFLSVPLCWLLWQAARQKKSEKE